MCILHLIEHGADVNFRDFQGFTALHYACMYGWSTVIESLIKAGGDINAVTVSCFSPLMVSMRKKGERKNRFKEGKKEGSKKGRN